MSRFYIDDVPVPQTMAEWWKLLETGDIKEKEMIQRDKEISTGLLIADMARKAGKNYKQLDAECGFAKNTTSGMTHRDDALFSTIVKIAKACGYKIRFTMEEDIDI